MGQQKQQQKNKTNINLVYAPALHESLCSSVPGLSCLSACPVFGRSQIPILLCSLSYALVILIITSFSHLPIVFGRHSLGKIFGMS